VYEYDNNDNDTGTRAAELRRFRVVPRMFRPHIHVYAIIIIRAGQRRKKKTAVYIRITLYYTSSYYYIFCLVSIKKHNNKKQTARHRRSRSFSLSPSLVLHVVAHITHPSSP